MAEASEFQQRTIEVPAEAAGQRLDQFIAAQLEGVSRSRVQMLMDQGDVLVDGGAREGFAQAARRRAHPDYRRAASGAAEGHSRRHSPRRALRDDDLAVVNKPAGMMVHAGSGQNDDERSKGTLVNALLYRFKNLSSTGGDLRPGIVHRLDKDTSGLIVVAKNDRTHVALGEMFSSRQMKKTYIALVSGAVAREKGTINASVSRDPMRRTRMTVQPKRKTRAPPSHTTR